MRKDYKVKYGTKKTLDMRKIMKVMKGKIFIRIMDKGRMKSHKNMKAILS